MSRYFSGSTGGSFLQAELPVVLTYPFTVSGWFRTSQPTRAVTSYLFWLGKKTTVYDWFAVSMQASTGRLQIEVRSGDTWEIAATTNAVEANKAQHFSATFTSATSRQIILNGDTTGAASDTAPCSPPPPDRTAIGRASDSTPSGGTLADIAHIAVHSRALTAGEKALLAGGANPRTISGLVDHWPITGTENPETGRLGSNIKFAVTGTTASSFAPPVQEYVPPIDPGDPGSETSVKKSWVSPFMPYKTGPDRVPTVTFPAKTIPAGAATRQLIAAISLTPEFTGTSISGVTYGGMAMTAVGNNGYGGGVDAVAWHFYRLTDPPTTAAQLVVTCNKNLWSASAFLFVVDDAGTIGSPVGSFNTASGNPISQVVPTEPGSLVIFVAAGQGYDSGPISTSWTNSVIEAQAPTSTQSQSTDHAVLIASKSIVSGTSETIAATLASADGRGWLALSIPPGTAPTPISDDITARVSVSDAYAEAAIQGTPARAQLIRVELDDAANKIRVALDGGSVTEASWSGSENAVSGPIYLGRRLLAGSLQTGGNVKFGRYAHGTEIPSAADHIRLRNWAAQWMAPETTAIRIGAETGIINTIDLTPGVRDRSGWGWQITAIDPAPAGTLTILDDHRLQLDLTDVTGGVISLNAQIASKHPLAPSSGIQITVDAQGVALTPVQAVVTAGVATLITVLPFNTDLTLVGVSDPAHGTTVREGQQIRYTAESDYVGTDEFEYTVVSSQGATGVGTVSLTVQAGSGEVAIPVPNFTATPTSGTAPLEVSFFYSGTEPVDSFAWDAGGSNVATARNPKFTFYTEGQKSVKLTATNTAGSKSITKTNVVTVTSGGTSPPPPPSVGAYPFGLPELMVSNFDSLNAGMTWASNFSAIGNCFQSGSHQVTVWENSGKRPVNAAHIDVQRPAIGEPLGLRVKYPQRTSTYKDGGGCNWGIFVNSGTGTPLSLTNGFRRAAISWDCYFPSDFANVNASIGRPFKFGGMAGGPYNGGFSGNPWSDGQGVGPEEGMYFPSNTVHASRGVPIGPGSDRGWSLRWQGTGRYDDDRGLMKPLPSLADPRTEVDKTTNPSWTVAAHYGRWQPKYDTEVVQRGAWNTFQIYFQGNTAGRSDGAIEYWINGVRIFEDYAVLFRRYATLAHTIWLGTFFGGTPLTDATDGSPQDNYLTFRNFRFAGSKT